MYKCIIDVKSGPDPKISDHERDDPRREDLALPAMDKLLQIKGR